MNKYLKFTYLILASFLLLQSCSENTGYLTITNCVDSNGNTVSENVTITVNGEEKEWTGNPINFRPSIDTDIGNVELNAEVDGYQLVSKRTYVLEKDTGVDVTLVFEAISIGEKYNDLNNTDTDNTEGSEITSEDDPDPLQDTTAKNNKNIDNAKGTVSFEKNPSNVNVRIENLNSNEIHNSVGSNIELEPGTYRWIADANGFASKSSTITVESNRETTKVALELERIIPTGTLNINISPDNATINITKRSDTYPNSWNIESFPTFPSTLQANQRKVELPIALYNFEINAPGGYTSETGQFEIKPSESYTLAKALIPASNQTFVQRLNAIESVNDAIEVSEQIKSENITFEDPDLLEQFVSEVNRIAGLLLNSGESARAKVLYQKIIDVYDPSNVNSRFGLSEILTQNGDVMTALDVLDELSGNLLNNFGPSKRLRVEYLVRFRKGEVYYNAFYSTSEDDPRRIGFGRSAISEFRDFRTRLESINKVSDFKSRYDKAGVFLKQIENDLS